MASGTIAIRWLVLFASGASEIKVDEPDEPEYYH